MCGIAGIVDPSRPAVSYRAEVASFLEALEHRGPDGQGTLFADPLALAHTRLAIVTDGPEGEQPLVSPDGRYVLLYNGEIVDWDRQEIESPFPIVTDTHYVLARLIAEGEGALHRLHGMFALLFWDRQANRGFLARDALGVKPLVYRQDGDAVWFASETRALVPEHPTRDLAALGLWAAIPAFSGALETPWTEVRVLPPGHLLRLGDRPVVHRWFQWEDREQPDDQVIRQTLATALEETGRARVSVASFLSGGLDSTLVTAHGHPDRAFVVRFEGQADFDYDRSAITFEDDTPHALTVAADLGVPTTLVDVPRAAIPRHLAAVARQDDRLPAWEQQITQQALNEAAAEQVKVVLLGDAADETWYGYHFLLHPRFSAGPAGPLDFFHADRRLQILRPELRKGVRTQLVARFQQVVADAGLDWSTRSRALAATSELIRTFWLGRLLHDGDIHGMAHGIENRVPFADIRVLRLAMGIDPGAGFAEGVEKAVLRRACPPIPARARWRKKSALPKDQGVEPAYRKLLASLVAVEDHPTWDWLHRPHGERLLAQPSWDETDRAMAFATLVFR